MNGKGWREENKFLSGEEDGRWFLCSFWITGEEEYFSFSSENGEVLHGSGRWWQKKSSVESV